MENVVCISIIVPIYNAEKYLKNCLDHLIGQTLKDIEIVCVDDHSTDASSKILSMYAQKDSRIKAVYLDENRGTSYVRKKGVEKASGHYIMFCDPDDMYELNACQTVWNEMSRDPVDILQFGTNVLYHKQFTFQEKKDLTLVLKPFLKKYEGNLCMACFTEKKWNYTLWNKAYKSEICKKAFSQISDLYIVVSEDLYAFFLLSFYSKCYRGISDKLYVYNFGTGITAINKQYINLRQFQKQCSQIYVFDELRSFVERNHLNDQYRCLVDTLKRDAIANIIFQWKRSLSISDAKKGYDFIIEKLGVREVISELANQFWPNSDEILDRLVKMQDRTIKGIAVKTIGVYYHRMRNGGVEKVLSILLGYWKRLGYELILLTDEKETIDDYAVPEGIRREILPNFAFSYGAKYKKRAKAWEYLISKYKIDTIIYNSCTCSTLMWDVCMIKGMGCNLIVETHAMFCGSMWYDPVYSSSFSKIYRMVDRVVALSSMDITFWSNYCPSYYIPNPVPAIDKNNISDCMSHNVLWIGRLSEEKCPDLMIEAFSIVHQAIPDATLSMVGDGDSPDWLFHLQEQAKTLGIADVVDFCGFQLETDTFYKNASILALTSMSESFSMVLAESKNYGIPAVMFELPNLELVKDKKGVISVPQKDVLALANGIITLLQNDELRIQMGKDARISLTPFLSFDIAQAWKSLFDGFEQVINYKIDSNVSLMLEMLLKSVHQGVEKVINESEKQQADNINLKYEEILNRHEEVVNRHEEVVNRHEEVINRHEKSINHQWEVQKWHEERIQALENANTYSVKKHLKLALKSLLYHFLKN